VVEAAIKSTAPIFAKLISVGSRDYVRGIARSLNQPVTYLGIAALAFVYGALACFLLADRDGARVAAERRAGNLAIALDQSFSHILKTVDASLLFLRKSYLQSPSGFDLDTWVSDPSVHNDLTFQFSIIDANGLTAQRSFSKGVLGHERSDREYFRTHLNSTADELVISKPVVLPVTGRTGLVLSRRITAADGTFAGIVSATLDPSQLTKQVGLVDLGQNGNVALTGLDGVVRIIATNAEVSWNNMGRALPPDAAVLVAARLAQSGSYWNTPGAFDDVSRLIAFRRLDDFPLIAAVGIAETEVYRLADKNADVYREIALLVSLALLIVMGFGAKREQKLIATTAQMTLARDVAEASRDKLLRAETMALLGHYEVDLQSGKFIWSDGVYRVMGQSQDSFIPTLNSVAELVHPDDRTILEQVRRELRSGLAPPPVTVRVFKDDGQITEVEVWSMPVRAIDGTVTGWFGTIQNVAARKRVEQALARVNEELELRVAERTADLTQEVRRRKMAQAALELSEQRYKLVEAAVNDGIWDKNLLSGEVYLSPRWKSILGYADHELTNSDAVYQSLLHPDDRAAVAEVRRKNLEEDKPLSIDRRMRCKDGSYRWVQVRGRIIRDAASRPVRIIGTMTDITDRKNAEEVLARANQELERRVARRTNALRESQERYQLVESAVNDGVWDWDILTGKDYLSPRWKGILGYADDELLNVKSTFFDLVHPDDKAAAVEATRVHLEERKPYKLDVRLRAKNGDYIWVHTRGTALYDATDRPVRMIGAITDISDRKRVEGVLASAKQNLETRIAERTAELAQEMRRREEAQAKLAQAQKMEAVGQLTAGVAHDFNNLLAVIQGGLSFVAGAAARGLTAEPELIEATLRATRRGAELVQRLLAFARQSPLKPEPTAVDQLMLDTLRLLQRTLGEHISVETNFQATAAMVLVDRNQLTNALLNLALNARDAMPEGGQLTVTTKCQPSQLAATEGSTRWPTGEEVCIVVRDTGAGMTEEVRNRVFEPFFTTKVDGLGTGLGLSMVHGFVQQSNGHIEIESEPERGTTITIRLPKVDTVSCSTESSAAAGPCATAREKAVLLVEDDPDVRIVTAAQLKQLGYRVHAVANGNEAIDMIESPASFDVLLTDVVLPGGIDGVTLIKEAMRARPGIGVLCMSGYDPSQNHRKWLRIQNIEFLEKPFSSSRLAQSLESTCAAVE
jgi:PAS domain S-box-containing protein